MQTPQAVWYHGTRNRLHPGEPVPMVAGVAYCTPSLDAAIWAAELAPGDDAPSVYEVALSEVAENATRRSDYQPVPYPSMTWCTRGTLTVVAQVTQWSHYHGTRADLQVGDLITPGYAANFGPTPRTANFVYFARTVDAAVWGAELAAGDAPSRVYVVEPTGEVEDDPNLTDQRFRDNPSKSFRSRAPLRVVGELTTWTGHPPEMVRAMKESLQRLDQAGIEPDDG